MSSTNDTPNNPPSQSASHRNRAYFSSPDQIYMREKPFLDAFAGKWTQEFLQHSQWLNIPTDHPLKMLDYACGNGMATFAALKLPNTSFSSITGIDVADGMVKLYNERVATASPDDHIKSDVAIRAFRGDLVSVPSADGTSAKDHNELVPELDSSAPEHSSFDLIATCLALHHFEDPALAIAKLAERLGENGVLFACDNVPGLIEDAEEIWEGKKEAPTEAGHGHRHGHGHHHRSQQEHEHKIGEEHKHGNTHGHGHAHAHAHARPDTGVTRQGFTRRGVEEMFAAAGLVDTKTRLMDLELEMPPSWPGPSRRMFWVVGRKTSK